MLFWDLVTIWPGGWFGSLDCGSRWSKFERVFEEVVGVGDVGGRGEAEVESWRSLVTSLLEGTGAVDMLDGREEVGDGMEKSVGLFGVAF